MAAIGQKLSAELTIAVALWRTVRGAKIPIGTTGGLADLVGSTVELTATTSS
jgi:hypothetical protein